MKPYNNLENILTPVFIKDIETGDYTAFYAEFPGAIAQGRDKKEAFELLQEIFEIAMKSKLKEFIKNFNEKEAGANVEYYPQMLIA